MLGLGLADVIGGDADLDDLVEDVLDDRVRLGYHPHPPAQPDQSSDDVRGDIGLAGPWRSLHREVGPVERRDGGRDGAHRVTVHHGRQAVQPTEPGRPATQDLDAGVGRERRDRYGVDVLRVQEALRAHTRTPVPLAPAGIAGLVNLRGQVVVLVSALGEAFLDGQAQPPAGDHLGLGDREGAGGSHRFGARRLDAHGDG